MPIHLVDNAGSVLNDRNRHSERYLDSVHRTYHLQIYSGMLSSWGDRLTSPSINIQWRVVELGRSHYLAN
ncbi:MAG: hypothetical protein V7L06_26820 [Nostoc sp.]